MTVELENQAFKHRSVLAQEAPEAVVTNPDGIYVDATFGRGGHSRRILEKLSSKGRLIAFDRDPQAIEAAKSITDSRFTIVHCAFSHLAEQLQAMGITQIDGILMDIGVSSPQIDDASRGFSFRSDGPLDMRMDTSQGQTAQQWLQSASSQEISFVLKEFGEERYARQIAEAIVRRRQDKPLETTAELAALVAAVIPRNKQDPHQNPATRTFQAIRIRINGELDELQSALSQAGSLLKPEARLVVISFHSLEDRIVKRFFDHGAHPEKRIDTRIVLRAADMPQPWWQDVIRIKPSEQECAENARSRSAVMRYAQRTSRVWADEAGGML